MRLKEGDTLARIIVITSGKGGVGKTTVAAMVVKYLAATQDEPGWECHSVPAIRSSG